MNLVDPLWDRLIPKLNSLKMNPSTLHTLLNPPLLYWGHDETGRACIQPSDRELCSGLSSLCRLVDRPVGLHIELILRISKRGKWGSILLLQMKPVPTQWAGLFVWSVSPSWGVPFDYPPPWMDSPFFYVLFFFFLNDRRERKVSQTRRWSKWGSAEEQMAACAWMLRSVMFYRWCRKGSGCVCVCVIVCLCVSVCGCVCGCVRVFSQLRVKRDPVHMLTKHFSSLMPFHSFTFPSYQVVLLCGRMRLSSCWNVLSTLRSLKHSSALLLNDLAQVFSWLTCGSV